MIFTATASTWKKLTWTPKRKDCPKCTNHAHICLTSDIYPRGAVLHGASLNASVWCCGWTEHVGLVPPPIFRDHAFYLVLFTCQLQQHKRHFPPKRKTRDFPVFHRGDILDLQRKEQRTKGRCVTAVSDVASDFVFCCGRRLDSELSPSQRGNLFEQRHPEQCDKAAGIGELHHH